MKRAWILILTLALALSLAACGGSKGKDVELAVFAAASMQETLTEIGENYQREHPGVTLVFNFDSSGTLKTQIEEGADCDIFISAGQKQMDQLDAAASPDVITDGLDFVLTDTRFNLLENKVALAVPDGNPAGINSYDDLKAALEAGDLAGVARRMYNVFEDVLEPRRLAEINEIKSVLIDCGALGASMSGSGPSVFGLFEDGARAQDACSRLRESYRDVFLCAPQ